MNDQFLNQQKPPRPEFTEALYQRITTMSPEITSKRTGYRLALGLFAFALLLILFVSTSPHAQAYVETFLRQIGVILVVNEESPQETDFKPDPNSLPIPTSTPIPSNYPSEWTSIDQLAETLGFRPLTPTYLPSGYSFKEMAPMEYVSENWKTEGMGSFIAYHTPSEQEHFVEVQQSHFTTQDLRQFPVGEAPIIDITVRGQAGIWVEQVTFDTENPLWDAVNLLMWEEDGFVFALFTDTLPLDEVMKIAESLQ